MSYQATNWAMKQRDMKPATKTVLLCLADRHNPENGCFPSHKRIATDACMSERSVRNHLAELEARGLLRRVRGTGGRLKRAATRYVFAFEDGFEAVDKSADRAESRRQKCAESRRQNLPPNPVREPLKEEDAHEAPASNDLFEGVKRAVGFGPNAILPSWWRDRAAREHVMGWKERFGLTDTEIIEIAAATRKEHPIPPDGPKALDRAMERRWRAKQAAKNGNKRRRHYKRPSAAPAKPVFSEYDRLKLRADWVNGDGFLPQSSLTNGDVQRLLQQKLVTPERLRQRGLGYLIPDGPWAARRETAA
ncbi:helix-turn-helix domain-containing protein [Roseovarius autotrophicus]|uniref:helix-turn-helix domain-containing protein n=1 Tax=Roseovarius autotrophicus TaxID=2824121 RepID=UPI001B36F524|nr:helix-turn-helix domain-containing protein [Roseovarius autotrophicus]